MFSLSYSSPAIPKGILKFKKQPWSLGYHRDTDGVLWDIHGYIGIGKKPWVQACKVSELHPGLASTASDAPWSYYQEWEPYYIEVETNHGLSQE